MENYTNQPRHVRGKIDRQPIIRRGLLPIPATPNEIDSYRNQRPKLTPLQAIKRPDECEKIEKSDKIEDFSEYDFGNKNLPIYKHKAEILEMVENNPISVLEGATGSGKTTQLGQFALESGYKIIYLVPRRVIVDNVGQRIEQELATKVGCKRAKTLVGMAHSEINTITDDSQIQIMTSGTFTKKLPQLANELADEKVLIVADEIHEGNLETEFASAFAARQVENNSNWRLVFASATLDEEILNNSTYKKINNNQTLPAIKVEGRPHNLENIYEENKDIVEAYEKYGADSQKTLIFVEGKRMIDQVISNLQKKLPPEESQKIRFMKLHANISEAARREIFEMELDDDEKAVIVSTSAGQSGITIPEVSLVISSGVTKSPELDDQGVEGLPIRFCTQAELTQQAGRAGRDIAGGKFVLARQLGYELSRNRDKILFKYTPHQSRPEHIPPEIYHSNISRNVLAAAAMGEDFESLNEYLQHSVSYKTINEAYDVLNKLGAVDDNYAITMTGKKMDTFPLRPELARSVYETTFSKRLPIQIWTIAIAAAIEAGGLEDIDASNSNWKNCLRNTTDDDFLMQWDLMKATREYYDGNDVNEERLEAMGFNFKNVRRAHKQFDKMCRRLKIEPRDIVWQHPSSIDEEELYDIFLRGMPDLIFEKTGRSNKVPVYRNIWDNDFLVDREISNRSLLGQSAVRFVAGYPRWFTDYQDELHNVVDRCFSVSREQIVRVLGGLAVTSYNKPELRGPELVKNGKKTLGSLVLGKVPYNNVAASSNEEIDKMISYLLYDSVNASAVDYLRNEGWSDKQIRKAATEKTKGQRIVTAYNIDEKLWEVVSKHQK